VEHSTRYQALRAAAMGTYGFDACVIPIGEHERGVVEAAAALLSGKRVLFVADSPAVRNGDLPPDITLVARDRYAAGDFSVAWLSSERTLRAARPDDETATLPASASSAGPTIDERKIAARRLKRIADAGRVAIARADMPAAPRLDLLAVLEDEIAWARASGIAFGIVLVHLPGLSSAKSGDGRQGAEQRLQEAQATIGSAIRAIDVIAGRADDFLAVLGEVDDAGARIAASRIAAAIEGSALRASIRPRAAHGFRAWSVGHAVYPSDGNTRDALLGRATASLTPIAKKHL
jgi:predicted signal transduction protein with EAL and GGDEF domain